VVSHRASIWVSPLVNSATKPQGEIEEGSFSDPTERLSCSCGKPPFHSEEVKEKIKGI
jgi:hypothetical protein